MQKLILLLNDDVDLSRSEIAELENRLDEKLSDKDKPTIVIQGVKQALVIGNEDEYTCTIAPLKCESLPDFQTRMEKFCKERRDAQHGV